jgi:hypothetical protein
MSAVCRSDGILAFACWAELDSRADRRSHVRHLLAATSCLLQPHHSPARQEGQGELYEEYGHKGRRPWLGGTPRLGERCFGRAGRVQRGVGLSPATA